MPWLVLSPFLYPYPASGTPRAACGLLLARAFSPLTFNMLAVFAAFCPSAFRHAAWQALRASFWALYCGRWL